MGISPPGILLKYASMATYINFILETFLTEDMFGIPILLMMEFVIHLTQFHLRNDIFTFWNESQNKLDKI